MPLNMLLPLLKLVYDSTVFIKIISSICQTLSLIGWNYLLANSCILHNYILNDVLSAAIRPILKMFLAASSPQIITEK